MKILSMICLPFGEDSSIMISNGNAQATSKAARAALSVDGADRHGKAGASKRIWRRSSHLGSPGMFGLSGKEYDAVKKIPNCRYMRTLETTQKHATHLLPDTKHPAIPRYLTVMHTGLRIIPLTASF